MNAPREERQAQIGQWVKDAFGEEQSASLPHRGIRMMEEAIELAQAAGTDQAMIHKLVDYVYARPVGEIGPEFGGLGVTLLALASAAGRSADEEEAKEVLRVLSKPLEHFMKRNAVKNAAGFDGRALGKTLDTCSIRTPKGDINNCALAYFEELNHEEVKRCQLCNGTCPDRERLVRLGRAR